MTKKTAVKGIDLGSLLNKLPGSIYCKDINGVYLGCNYYMARMAGFSTPEEIVGKTDHDMSWWQQADALRVIDQAVINSGVPKTLEETGRLASGKWATYLTIKEPLRDDQGQIIGIYGLSVEITERKQRENKLLQEHRAVQGRNKNIFSNLEQIIACLPGYIYWKDKSGVYQGCNDQFVKEVGVLSRQEIIGKTDEDFAKAMGWGTEIAKTFRQIDDEVIRSGCAKLNVEELPFHFADGKTIHQLTNKVPLYDENGQAVGVLGISTDITAHKKKEMVFLEQVFACMPGAIFWKGKNGVYLGCNEEFSKVIGIEKSAILGKTDDELVKEYGLSASDVESLVGIDKKVVRSGAPQLNAEVHFVRRPGQKKTVFLVNKMPLRDMAGQVIGLVGISVDITHQKQIEESLRKAKEAAEVANSAKTAFLENMRHDIRTPLTGIVGFAQLIKEEISGPTLKNYAENLLASSESLLDFLNEILEAVRLASGEVPIQKKKFILQEKLQFIIALNQAKADEKKIALSLDYDERIPRYLVGDSRRVQRIVLELVVNALKFTQQGAIKVTVTAESSTGTDHLIKIVVADTGIGIPKDKQEEIFGSFNRLHHAYLGKFQGAGLGLTIVKQFIDDLNGEIYLDSVEQNGADFVCFLPLKAALMQDDSYLEPAAEVMGFKTNLSLERKPLQIAEPNTMDCGVKILVVEDSDVATKVAEAILHQLGCQVDLAKNGTIAIHLAKKTTYDLIFMDVGLPDMSGNDATTAIRDWEAHLEQHTPIVGLTAHIEVEHKQQCMSAGMDAVLSKPLRLDVAKDLLAAFIPSFSASGKNSLASCSELTTFDVSDNEDGLFTLPEKSLDFELVAKISSGAIGWMKEILPEMLEDIQCEQEKIEQAYANDQWQLIADFTHKLKGGAASCGTARLEKACLHLERYIRAGQTKLREPLYRQLLQTIDTTKPAITEWINTQVN